MTFPKIPFVPDFQTMHSLMYSSLRIFWRMLQLWLIESDLKVVQGDCGGGGIELLGQRIVRGRVN